MSNHKTKYMLYRRIIYYYNWYQYIQDVQSGYLSGKFYSKSNRTDLGLYSGRNNIYYLHLFGIGAAFDSPEEFQS